MSIFNKVQSTKLSSNIFDLSHDKKMSLKMGQLVPIHTQEIVPGDQITMSTSQMLRMAPMIAPVMHNVKVYTHFFFVPNRIMWDKWEDFITGGESGIETPAFPYIDIDQNNVNPGSIGDYLGLPTIPVDRSTSIKLKVSVLPVAMYAEIYNEYYRDQNLQDKLDTTIVDGDNNAQDLFRIITDEPYYRAWQHDYFTSALPWTQKGVEVTIPIGDTADIQFQHGSGHATNVVISDGSRLRNLANTTVSTGVTGKLFVDDGGFDTWADIDNSSNLYADLSTATASSINDLRKAFKLQEWLERNARAGSRYTETILAHFGVKSSDARLQRPEYLGGGQSNVVISEVLQTSESDLSTPQGNMAGHGINVGASSSFRYRAEEHGYIIGIMSVMPKSAYFQGIPKHFTKFDKFDYYWESFSRLGEQPILVKEIYAKTDTQEEQEEVFGYTPRYAEYKFIPSSVHGEFRTSLDFWHMGRKFNNKPVLNGDFIECKPTSRIFAVTDSEQIYAHIFHSIKARRKMPYFGTPTL